MCLELAHCRIAIDLVLTIPLPGMGISRIWEKKKDDDARIQSITMMRGFPHESSLESVLGVARRMWRDGWNSTTSTRVWSLHKCGGLVIFHAHRHCQDQV
jgi:hypothetical protein